MLKTVLLVDDDTLHREAVRSCLSGYNVKEFESIHTADRFLERSPTTIVLLDLYVQGISTLPYIKNWSQKYPGLRILCCSGESRAEIIRDCLLLGVCDFLIKPFIQRELLHSVKRILEGFGNSPFSEFVAASPAMKETIEILKRLKGHTSLNILFLGESGSGKEVLARYLHSIENDSRRPFVVVNMAGIPHGLVESELFGHEKGAFTDAHSERLGQFELAHCGDILLDEIGDTPYEIQPKILRVLQTKEAQRIGSNKSQRLLFRLIAATNQNLSHLVEEGRFREDLLYRLSDVVIRIPPLRERKEDILPLALYFLKKYSSTESPLLSKHAIAQLLNYTWPGNVRELESTMKRTAIFATGPTIDTIEIYNSLHAVYPRGQEHETHTLRLKDIEKNILFDVLKQNNGNRKAAMSTLGMSRATFYRKLKQYRS